MNALRKNQKPKILIDLPSNKVWEELKESVQISSNQKNGKKRQANPERIEHLLNMAFKDLLKKLTQLN